ncbi:TPA: IS4 family transposase [Legionella pneumophila]|nr:IS4 family transposase [Legionella pneumophila]HAU1224827.1 IS4 family transposase [Legionella pneumophila]
MHLMKLLHKTFEEKLSQIHKNRIKSLMSTCEAAISSNKLYLTGLGRAISNTNKECSNIQKVDRLLGNGHLQREREFFYKVMASHVIHTNETAWIHIDWACINSTTNLYILRASISMHGRCFVIYEECHSEEKYNNHIVHKSFLNQLKRLLPQHFKPIIVTDAGFRAPWFSYILSLGWDFVGRLRHKNALCIEGTSTWKLSSDYYQHATAKPTYIGSGLLTEQGKVPVHIILYKSQNKGRLLLTRDKKRSHCGMSERQSRAAREPWLLVSSLKESKCNPGLIINIYRQRMRIEENIRDTKCPHYGLGLKKSLTKSSHRMNILLLIAAIATFAAWLAGLFVKSIGKAADFQAHSAKFTSALSYVFLGKRALMKELKIRPEEFENTLVMINQCSLLAHHENPHYG